jgi:cytochrome c553
MGPFAADLSDGQVKLLGAYFARQTPDRNEAVVTGAALERHGQATVAAKGCAASAMATA